MDLLEGLNPEQKSAVEHQSGPLMIVAGAGTGKTMVITRRIAWLIDQKLAAPENILALTFTDKAAGEMEERVDLLLPYGYVDIQISTFHSFCEKVLREFGAEIGLSPDFKVLAELDAWLLARARFSDFALDYYRPLGNPTKYLRGLLTHFSRAKDNALTADRYLEYAAEQAANQDQALDQAEAGRLSELASAYHQYQQILLANDSLDFGDLLLYVWQLLKTRPKILQQLQAKYQYLLVDEFQDTNRIQYEIVKLLAAPKNNLTVVGDDDQAIYRFRGASVANILQFQKDFPDCQKVVLKNNYRSGQAILDLAYSFIQMNNPDRLETQMADPAAKKLTAQTEHPGLIEHLHYPNLEQEAAAVARKIQELQAAGPDLHWGDFAILIRANDAAAPFIQALERRQIPFRFMALRGLYSKPIILDLLAHLRIIDQPHDSPSFYRILNQPIYQIPPEAVIELNQLARRKGKSLYEACRLASLANLPPQVFARVNTVLSDLDKFQQLARNKKCSELLITLARDGHYVEFLRSLTERESHEAFRWLQQLYERILSFENRHDDKSLANFMAEFAFERDAGEEGALAQNLEEGPEVVKIMTVHSAKGLEFKYVFVINLVDQRFPTRRRPEAIPLPDELLDEQTTAGDWHLAEERRLFYVALTRAKQGLFLTSADDYGGARRRKLSRFLIEAGFAKTPELLNEQTAGTFDAQEEITVTLEPLTIHLPKQFSFTQLTAFRTCPLQYKFAHVLKIPVFGKWTFSFGKTMHNTLQQFFKLWIERVGSRQGNLFAGQNQPADGSLPVKLEELLEAYQKSWQDDWYQNDDQREEYRTKGRAALKDYYRQMGDQPPEPHMLEQGFTLKFGAVIIKGRIDRIDRCAGGVEIIDYKTGKAKTEKTLDRGDKEQLLLYQIAARDVLGLQPIKLTYHYLEDNSQVSFLGSDDELLDLQEQILERVEMIRHSNFSALPGFHCRFCDFADICEYRET
ncbi:ATP-dependent helicase [Patescibacteria group bacterium]|nr:ATP-dependent helicase [Patescibacteria group bacterium]MBU1705339.1 ATP-dependent helicase [Patescibacteria group bacterium]